MSLDKYFTVMLIPEREKGVRSIRIPRVLFHGVVFLFATFLILLGILSYDYWKILRQVYENKHLTIENRQLKEQIQLFQMKINTLTDDLERIYTFEKKLRIITGTDKGQLLEDIDEEEIKSKEDAMNKDSSLNRKQIFNNLRDKTFFENDEKYLRLKNLYEQKIATTFGLQTGYTYTKEWSALTKKSFSLATKFAVFDYQFNRIKSFVKNLEINVHELDQHLLDKTSLLRSTPTLLPTKGWITDYYGPRKSPWSGRLKMHEGLDIGALTGTPIFAPADGIVTFAGQKSGFGKFVQIDHGYGVETIYAHAKKVLTKKGSLVKRGQLIAKVGSTGHSTGPHVHYEIRVNGTPVDPYPYILD